MSAQVSTESQTLQAERLPPIPAIPYVPENPLPPLPPEGSPGADYLQGPATDFLQSFGHALEGEGVHAENNSAYTEAVQMLGDCSTQVAYMLIIAIMIMAGNSSNDGASDAFNTESVNNQLNVLNSTAENQLNTVIQDASKYHSDTGTGASQQDLDNLTQAANVFCLELKGLGDAVSMCANPNLIAWQEQNGLTPILSQSGAESLMTNINNVATQLGAQPTDGQQAYQALTPAEVANTTIEWTDGDSTLASSQLPPAATQTLSSFSQNTSQLNTLNNATMAVENIDAQNATKDFTSAYQSGKFLVQAIMYMIQKAGSSS